MIPSPNADSHRSGNGSSNKIRDNILEEILRRCPESTKLNLELIYDNKAYSLESMVTRGEEEQSTQARAFTIIDGLVKH